MAENLSVQAAFVAAGAGAILGALVGLRQLALPDLPDVEPLRYWPEPELALEPEPRAGPVLVTVEWRIDPARREEFAEAMRPVERARRQTGATRWGLFQDAADPALFVETFMVSTWSEHLRQHLERGIASDKQLEDRALAFLVGEPKPQVRHLLWSYDR